MNDPRIRVVYPPAKPGQACAPGVWHATHGLTTAVFRTLDEARHWLEQAERLSADNTTVDRLAP